MPVDHLTPQPKQFYEALVKELEDVAQILRHRPELNHHSAERLEKIAADIRVDAGLPLAPPNAAESTG
jgi:hypothetical protein